MAVIMSTGTSLDEINRLQLKSGVILAPDYIDFLLKFNGMFIGNDSYCTMEFSTMENKEIDFQELYGIKTKNINFDIIEANKIRDEVLALEKPFVIGADPGGNPFLINGTGNDSRIYYWDRTHLNIESIPDYLEKEEEGDIYIYTATFTDFYRIIRSSIGGDVNEKIEKI